MTTRDRREMLSRWLRIATQSPHLPIVAFLVLVGVVGLVPHEAPDEIARTFPAWLTWTWAGSLAAGGVVAIAGCVTERSRAESAGLAFCLFGLVLFVAVRSEGWVSAAALGLMCLSRLWVLHKARATYEEVKRIVGRDGS